MTARNTRNRYFPAVSIPSQVRASPGALAVVSLCALACGRFPPAVTTTPTIWIAAEVAAGVAAGKEGQAGAFIALDSVALRPVSEYATRLRAAGGRVRPDSIAAPTAIITGRRTPVVTSFQGGRYHPETVRALAADRVALAATAGLVAVQARAVTTTGIIIDLQGMAATDIRALIAVTRAIADSARAYVLGPIGFVVPAADTAAYPGALIARTADLIVVRFEGEHRPGTLPGPGASPQWLARHLGARAAEVGASRVVAELPLFGYRWERDGSARRVTYDQALADVVAEALTFSRDPVSMSLRAASPRDGWEIWINDHETVAFLISAARRIGVNRFVLAGADGADPSVWATHGGFLAK